MKHFGLRDRGLFSELDRIKGFKIKDLQKEVEKIINKDKTDTSNKDKTGTSNKGTGTSNQGTGTSNQDTGNTNKDTSPPTTVSGPIKKMIVPVAVGGSTMVASRFFFRTGWIASTVIGIGAGVGTHLIINKENNNINN